MSLIISEDAQIVQKGLDYLNKALKGEHMTVSELKAFRAVEKDHSKWTVTSKLEN